MERSPRTVTNGSRATGDDRSTTDGLGRRRFLGAFGAAVAAGIAGCSDGGSSGPPLAQPPSHAQDMTMEVSADGTERVSQEVHLELDDPDFLMEISTGAPGGGGGAPLFDARFIKVDGSMYLQMGMGICQEYGQSESDVQAMAATPQRFQGQGSLEQTDTTTVDGTEVEVWEGQVSDLPMDQFNFSPQVSGGFSGGQMPQGGGSQETPAYTSPDRVEEGSLRLLIGAEDRYLYEAEQTATFVSDGSRFSFDMTADNYDFGESFDIEAPSNCGSGDGFGGGSGGGSGGFGDGTGGFGG